MHWLHVVTLMSSLLAADTATKAPEVPVPARMHTTVIGAHKFTLPSDLKIELIAGPPLIERPIHADFDEQGRLYVAESSGSNDPVKKQLEEKPHRLVRLEDTDGDGKFDRRTIFADKLMFPEGMLWHAGSVYVAAPPSIWKLTDTNGDGVADVRIEWFQGKTLTNCANDLHGPYLGPDGWIYWCKGAFARQTYDRPGKKPFVTRAAHIFRARPDGSGMEPVMTGGMDNPVEIAFTRTGERIFTTTFFQYPAGGQRDGLIHSIYGGVYGKIHDVIDEHPRTGEVLPPMTHMGPAAPAGICRLTTTDLHPEYWDSLFVAQFNMHKVSRHTIEPMGATFKTTDFEFLASDNLDFHPTDVLEHGRNLFVINTGGWYKLCCPSSQLWKPDVLGGIYRIAAENQVLKESDPRRLMRLSNEDLIALFQLPFGSNYDRSLYLNELDRRGKVDVELAMRQMQAASPIIRCDTVWILTRLGTPAAREAIRCALRDSDPGVVQAALNSVSLVRDREAISFLLPLLTNNDLHVRRLAAEALGRIGSKEAVPYLLQAAGKEIPRELEHAIIYALIEIADRSETAVGLSSHYWRTQRATVIALDQMENGQLTADAVARFLASTHPPLREAATWISGRHADWGGALAPVLKEQLNATKLSATDKRDLAQQLATFAKNPAIQTLLADSVTAVPGSPSARPIALQAMAQAGLKSRPETWSLALLSALQGQDLESLQAAVTVARKLPPAKAHEEHLTAALSRLADDGRQPDQLRLDALSALPGLLPPINDVHLKFLQQHLRGETPVLQRLAAVDVISRSKLSDSQLNSLCDSIRTAGPLEIERLLAPFAYSQDEAVSRSLIEALAAASALANVRPETLQKLFANRSDAIRKAAEAVTQKLAQSTQQQRTKLQTLLAKVSSGDARRGQLVFHSQKAACTACHALGYVGGRLGPDLSRVGRIRTERDLLEAILFPSASFVRSYEPVVIVTKAGKTHSGLVRKDSAEEIILAINARDEVRIPREEIDELHPGSVSIMPAGLDQQLTPQELADLIVFLKTAK